MSKIISIASILCVVLLVAFTPGDNPKGKTAVTTSLYNASYQSLNGMFQGRYTSTYKNGQKKADGLFNNNNRNKEWSFFDSTGVLRVKRKYIEPNSYEILFPELPKDSLVSLFANPVIVDLNVAFDETKAPKDWWQRVGRRLLPEANPVLFENNKLFTALIKGITDGTLKAVNPETNTPLTLAEVTGRMNEFGSTVAYYELTELNFFSLHSMSAIKRAELLNVVVTVSSTDRKGNVSTKDVVLFQVAVNEFEKAFAKEKLFHASLPTYVSKLSDVFLYNAYAGQIYWNRDFSLTDRQLTAQQFTVESAKLETDLLEMEHSLIIYYSKKSTGVVANPSTNQNNRGGTFMQKP